MSSSPVAAIGVSPVLQAQEIGARTRPPFGMLNQ